MVTFKDLEKVLSWTKRTGHRVIIHFQGYPYSVVIDKFIRASERGRGFVEWYRAFGPRPPHAVLSVLKIEKVIVEKRDGSEEVLRSFSELLRRV